MAFFLLHIFRSRLRTFSEAPALFTMYKSEGPISKTSEPPDRRPGVAEITGGKGRRRPKKVSTCRHGDALLNRFIDSAPRVGTRTGLGGVDDVELRPGFDKRVLEFVLMATFFFKRFSVFL